MRKASLDPPQVRENLARHFDNAQPALVVLDNLPGPEPDRRPPPHLTSSPNLARKAAWLPRATPARIDGCAAAADRAWPDDALRLLARYRSAASHGRARGDGVPWSTRSAVTPRRWSCSANAIRRTQVAIRALQHLRRTGSLPRIETPSRSALRDELGEQGPWHRRRSEH